MMYTNTVRKKVCKLSTYYCLQIDGYEKMNWNKVTNYQTFKRSGKNNSYLYTIINRIHKIVNISDNSIYNSTYQNIMQQSIENAKY